jgi:hypothetical protein
VASSGSRQEPVAGSCEYDNETPSSAKVKTHFDLQKDWLKRTLFHGVRKIKFKVHLASHEPKCPSSKLRSESLFVG